MNNTDRASWEAGDAGAPDTAGMTRLLDALTTVCAPTTPPHAERLDAAITAAWRAPASTLPRQAVAGRGRSLQAGLFVRVAALVALLGAAGGCWAAYLLVGHPAPASAQEVLSRAAAASRLAPNEAAHLTYAFTPHVPGAGGGLAGPVDVWLQEDAQGHTARFALTFTVSVGGATVALERTVLDGGTGRSYTYDPQTNAVALAPATAQQSSLGNLQLFDPSSVAAFLQAAAQAAPGKARLLPQQTLDGTLVDVVQLPADPAQNIPAVTAYFDAQTYLFRGLDTTSGPVTLRLRVTKYDLVAASAVPPGTFTLNVPPSAHVVPSINVPEFVPGD